MAEVLSCSLCFGPYDAGQHRPLLLPACGHTFCKACLGKLPRHECPEDRSTIPDILNLPTNILVVRSLDSSRPQIPGMSEDVKFIRSEDVELQQKVGEGGSGTVWKALYKFKTVS